jgi:hypothetical protein
MEAVLRLPGGEPLGELSRELGVEAHRLAAWRDDSVEGGREALKGQRPGRSGEDRALRQAERKVGQLPAILATHVAEQSRRKARTRRRGSARANLGAMRACRASSPTA